MEPQVLPTLKLLKFDSAHAITWLPLLISCPEYLEFAIPDFLRSFSGEIRVNTTKAPRVRRLHQIPVETCTAHSSLREN